MRPKIAPAVIAFLILAGCQALTKPPIQIGYPGPKMPTSVVGPAKAAFTEAQLRNAQYCLPFVGACMKLQDGVALDDDTSLQMLDLQASGDLDGDGTADAVILIREAVATAGNTDVVAVVNRGALEAPQIQTAALGPGVTVDELSIAHGEISVHGMVEAKVGDVDRATKSETWTFVLAKNGSSGLIQTGLIAGLRDGTERGITIANPANGSVMPDRFVVRGTFARRPEHDALAYCVHNGAGWTRCSGFDKPLVITGSSFSMDIDIWFAPAGKLWIEIGNIYDSRTENRPLEEDWIFIYHEPQYAQPTAFFTELRMVDANYGWAWTERNLLFRTEDGGSTWTPVALRTNMWPAGGFFLSGEQAWIPAGGDPSQTSAIYHTGDGGMTWEQLSVLRGPIQRLFFQDPLNGWALVGGSVMQMWFYEAYQTRDGGRSWTLLHGNARGGGAQTQNPSTIVFGAGGSITFGPPATIWIAKAEQPYVGLTVSWNGGKTWADLNPPLELPGLGADLTTVGAPQFVSPKVAYLPVVTGSGTQLIFFVTRDSGRTWRLLPPVLESTATFPRAQFMSELDGFAVCGYRLCATHDGGMTWQKVGSDLSFGGGGMGPYLSRFQFVGASTGWAFLVDGYNHVSLLQTTDGGTTWTILGPTIKLEKKR